MLLCSIVSASHWPQNNAEQTQKVAEFISIIFRVIQRKVRVSPRPLRSIGIADVKHADYPNADLQLIARKRKNQKFLWLPSDSIDEA